MADAVIHTLTLDAILPVKLTAVNLIGQTATFNVPEAGGNITANVGDVFHVTSSRTVARSETLTATPNSLNYTATLTSDLSVPVALEAVVSSNDVVLRFIDGRRQQVTIGNVFSTSVNGEFRFDQDADF